MLKIGISTCPNDTFMFDAMLHGKIDTGGLEFELTLADIENLNKMAASGSPDITKLSFFAYAKVADKYQLLTSGAALGEKNGPLLISKHKIYPDEVEGLHVAIPGINTTANLLLTMAFPDLKRKTEYLFSDIEEAILSNEVDAGLIIHETRFTYGKKGLKKIMDMGEYWEEKTGFPLPLGGIAIKRALPTELKQKVNAVLRKSIEYSLKNPSSAYEFMKSNARELDNEVMYKHIELYVNQYSVEMGDKGKEAVQLLYKKASALNILKLSETDIFL
jgi:1,4-dihydroxy-6-naphthoate synthase